MKIAIPTEDKINISAHFGRTKCFAIYDIDDQKISKAEYRNNSFTGHARGMHHEHHQGEQNHGEHHQHHTHGRILNALADCQVVIAGGMGRRLLDDLSNAGMQVFITREVSIENAVHAYLEDTLDHSESAACKH